MIMLGEQLISVFCVADPIIVLGDHLISVSCEADP